MINIALWCDHAGFEKKEILKQRFTEKKYWFTDYGCHSSESVDYPDFIHPVAKNISKKVCQKGIVFCTTGNGSAMAANRHKGIRAALCWNQEITSLARHHNDANILVIPAWYINQEMLFQMVDIFLETEFDGGRHERRICKIEI